MELKTPEFPNGRDIIVIGNDITFMIGSFGPREDILYQANNSLDIQCRFHILPSCCVSCWWPSFSVMLRFKMVLLFGCWAALSNRTFLVLCYFVLLDSTLFIFYLANVNLQVIKFLCSKISLKGVCYFLWCVQKASEMARKSGMPRIYLSANSGARLGLAEEIKHLFRVAWEDPSNPDKVSICLIHWLFPAMFMFDCRIIFILTRIKRT